MNLKHSISEFSKRHIGPDPEEIETMLQKIGVSSVEQLIDETVPPKIRLESALNLPPAMSEFDMLQQLKDTSKKNRLFKSYLGLGYSNCITPSVIQRNIFENPGWYTQYTPYQAEISQGRLEALLNFQTMVIDLTGLPIANASLLDESTAAAEAMTMFYRLRSRELRTREAKVFLVSDKCLPQTIDVLKTRAVPQGIELQIGDSRQFEPKDNIFGAILQYPDVDGRVADYSDVINSLHECGAMSVVCADLLSLTVLKPPGEIGADVVCGSSQRFGVPLGYGGPHAAFFATREEYKRQIPGRIVGVSVDAQGDAGYRMALQTREQHIRREKATSNICTAQALLAIMAGMYAVYHGPDGLRTIATTVNALSSILTSALKKLGFSQTNESFFDTISIAPHGALSDIRSAVEKAGMNFNFRADGSIGISLDETTRLSDVQEIVDVFATATGNSAPAVESLRTKSFENIAPEFRRKSKYLQHPVFSSYASETKMMRYIKSLENKDLSLTTSMIPLGSCTMKLNAATEMFPVSWPEYSQQHPFAPTTQTAGYLQLFSELEAMLAEITGFAAVSLQPNSGAQGEYAGLMVIREYHHDRGDENREVVLIPSSAHGTNPASAVMCGMDVIIIKCDDNGNVDIQDLQEKAQTYKETLAGLMVTYPSTHGVFESGIKEICDIIHENGGQVYMDGANLNAQVGLTNPALIGADVCHMNLHKTFSIPHGGGGPGMGPIAVASHLEPYLPNHPLIEVGGDKGITAVSATPWGSASILPISYAYIRMLGPDGLKRASEIAILNANYILARLQDTYPVLYRGEKGRVAHELIFDLRPFKATSGIEVEDVAKRLMDYGFHAPTVSFPVPGTLMVEPTESEALDELDRFCDAMLSIRDEIRQIESGEMDKNVNVLKNAPHTARVIAADDWPYPYSREQAVFPLAYLRDRKFWPPIGRIDNVYGDRNLVCACPPIEVYESP